MEPPSSSLTRPPQCCLWTSQMTINTSSPGLETRRPQFMKSNISEKSDEDHMDCEATNNASVLVIARSNDPETCQFKRYKQHFFVSIYIVAEENCT